MNEFLCAVDEMIRQLSEGRYKPDRIHERIKETYQILSEEEKEKNIQRVDGKLRGNQAYYFFIMSTLLPELGDCHVLQKIRDMLVSRNCLLWERCSYMYHLKYTMFASRMPQIEEGIRYRALRDIYEGIQQDIRMRGAGEYPYIPYQDRKKTVVMVAGQLLDTSHAPTRKFLSIYRYLQTLGYEVKAFVCFYPGKIDGDNIFWNPPIFWKNFCDRTTFFDYNIEDVTMKGCNLILEQDSFLDRLGDFAGLIWDEKPEFVFELGDMTMLAGLCSRFTTVVTMGCTKSVPVTTALIVARYFDYSEEEDQAFRACLTAAQTVIDVKHAEKEFEDDTAENEKLHKKQDFGIPENAFAIVIAGNRLDSEITAGFLNVIYDILEKDERFVTVIIGECEDLKQTIAESRYVNRVFFTGNRRDFRETIAVGDVFLNPPRQGGGTGGFFAGELGIPVITLNHCDVESVVGKEFACDSVEEMPHLVYRYFTDHEFYEKQKECIMKNIGRQLNVDSVENFRRLCELVKTVAEEKEREANEC